MDTEARRRAHDIVAEFRYDRIAMVDALMVWRADAVTQANAAYQREYQRAETLTEGIARLRAALVALSVGHNGKCWDRYGCWTMVHDDLCVKAVEALRASGGNK